MVYIVDKVENNTAQVGGHPAWAVAYNIDTNTFRPMDIISNSFCAGGTALGNGSYLNVGGNAPVTAQGVAILAGATGAANPYDNVAGGKAARLLTPCDDDSCEWTDDVDFMPLSRWYPTVETLPTGDAIIIGGELYGSFVNTPEALQNVPSFEFWPTRGAPVNSTFLANTMPINLYPWSFLMADGRIFMQAQWLTQLLDYETGEETALPNITHAQRPYPAGAGGVMLPMLPSDNYTQRIMFAGGMTPERDDWNQNLWDIASTPASTSAVVITPLDPNPTWADLDDLPEPRAMGNLILLPDQRVLMLNGAGMGSEGYGWEPAWAINQSYAQSPVLRPAYFNASQPKGQQWDTNVASSTIPRMYHSTATLLYDGSVFVSGSNPNVDVITEQNNASYIFKTEYRVERFYPSYYDSPRPAPSGLPTTISYGGNPFNFTLPSSSLSGIDLANDLAVTLIRTGFSTHVVNMGARLLVLPHSYTTNSDGSATIHTSQLPANPALFVPGPALLFIVIKGVPSNASSVMIGSGQLGQQPTSPLVALPLSNSVGSSSSASDSSSKQKNGAAATGMRWEAVAMGLAVAADGLSRV
ncbi:hypothetical protein JCM1841_002135 [Sporobolomyces salmonicolor]